MSMKCPKCGNEIALGEESCSCGYQIPVSHLRTLMGTPPPVKEVRELKKKTDTPDLRELGSFSDTEIKPEITKSSADSEDLSTVKDNRKNKNIEDNRDPLIGQTLGEYKVVKMIGQGGMGSVYKGMHPLIGKVVAIKVLKSTLSENNDMMGRFLAEAKAVNAIGHPNIVDIFSFGESEDGSTYFVMEYLEGMTFTEYLSKHPVISYKEAHLILKQILGALKAAHNTGIIHRDIKPDNIFLVKRPSTDYYVKLLDFGIAKFTEDGFRTSHTKTGVPIGTPFYMSPEQCAGQLVDKQSDIYSVGVILYEMFTGRLPFKGDSFMAILQAHITQTPYSPSTVVEINKDLENIILWCLKKEKNSRPQNIDELSEKLLPLLDKLAISQSETSPKMIDGATIPDVKHFSISDVGSTKIINNNSSKIKYVILGILGLIVIFGVLALTGVIKFSTSVKNNDTNSEPQLVKSPKSVIPVIKPIKVKPSPQKVTFQLQISPSGLHPTVFVNGKKSNKKIFSFPKGGHEVEFKVIAKGYKPWSTKIKPVVDSPVIVTLEKIKPVITPMVTPMAPVMSTKPHRPRPMKKNDVSKFL